MHSALARAEDLSLGRAGNRPIAFRPVQYLGNKLRALDEIVQASEDLAGPTARVADLFSGSSVVAQALAAAGHRVAAVDTQEYARVFASATLAIGRGAGEGIPITRVAETAKRIQQDWQPWLRFADEEAACLASGDADALRQLYCSLPNCWRSTETDHYSRIANGNKATFDAPLITTIYAGTYFGVRQSIWLDALRHAIEHHSASGELSTWQREASLTALMSAASAAVHSAGKHFAQHLLAGSSDNHRFLKRRLLEDRSIDVVQTAKRAANALEAQSVAADAGHSSHKATAEAFTHEHRSGFDLFYLDPPYTAQQYSRFYHLLETLVGYQWPALLHKGSVTVGLYPQERFKSAFSSKTKALGALRSIVEMASEDGAALLISYSQSASASDRNVRMVTFEDLLSVCRNYYGSAGVRFARLTHRYRQFNSSANANLHRDDPEILVQCKKR